MSWDDQTQRISSIDVTTVPLTFGTHNIMDTGGRTKKREHFYGVHFVRTLIFWVEMVSLFEIPGGTHHHASRNPLLTCDLHRNSVDIP